MLHQGLQEEEGDGGGVYTMEANRKRMDPETWVLLLVGD